MPSPVSAAQIRTMQAWFWAVVMMLRAAATNLADLATSGR
ncbi:hypothetical protein ACPOL_0560 [Acidisarcina polymorpha]|uniref:Uncharacterized protein n=1 Tax=Acidisarcina polymorpha TaxID=2211140 RepID=A0A2Z5FU26_9BACT|nr:hypothetical protein ACPOL_0560 [Acidisarcina polymorpha]